MTQTKKAFTLVEAIVVIMIIVILTTISFVVNKTYIPNTRDTRRYSEITKIYNKIQGEILINPKLNVENFITGLTFQPGNTIIVDGKTYSGLLIGEINFDVLKEDKKNFGESLVDLEDYKIAMIPNANYYAILASRETEKTIPNGNRFTTENKESKMIVGDFNYNDLLAYTGDEGNEDNNDNFCQFDVSSFNLCISKL